VTHFLDGHHLKGVLSVDSFVDNAIGALPCLGNDTELQA